MKLQLAWTVALAALAPAGAMAEESSWIFSPAAYTHSPATGQRVAQYCPEMPAYARDDSTYQESGYRHSTTSIRVGDSADHTHIVQTWGEGERIRPYGEWLYPYRAGATPYGPWGNPQGPWTLPFDSWQNPYGLGRLPQAGWPQAGWPQAAWQQGMGQQGMMGQQAVGPQTGAAGQPAMMSQPRARNQRGASLPPGAMPPAATP